MMNKQDYFLYLDLATRLLAYSEEQRKQIFDILDIHILSDEEEHISRYDYLKTVNMTVDYLGINKNKKLALCSKLHFLLENYSPFEIKNMIIQE